MKKLLSNLLILATSAVVYSCSKSETGDYHPKQIIQPVDSTAITALSSDWMKAVHLMKDFPTGVQVYLNKKPINNKTTVMYAVVFDPKLIELKPVASSTNKKVSDFYNEEISKKFACINAGFFGPNASYSLSMFNGTVSAINIKSLTRKYNGNDATYYPTRAAFGLKTDNTADVTWVYHVGSGNGTIYSYPAPSPNILNSAPQALPSATFPAGGTIWDATTAIGGSPMLIKNNNINISDDAELIVIDNNSSRARSAIGYTANKKVIMLAVEGNNTSGGTGLTLAELAQVMKDMGCVGAINLDGGGSTALYVNGAHTVKPSDAAGERPVITALILKSK
ncbi:phosphodiester glycosidase family protein [Pedobacter xixiisoli]|uniref:Phosphodiester glycosidase domain-containing protein n=1 Tax=Pedobacter xixiisoli TaxID=1476464 RepID=A0A286ADC0_9SPHI|nr:phosphodiester glycosidase family protein [Pedobacter xixiisoli]SOD19906.1 Predicted protein [Pedobacter xixiisoli]